MNNEFDITIMGTPEILSELISELPSGEQSMIEITIHSKNEVLYEIYKELVKKPPSEERLKNANPIPLGDVAFSEFLDDENIGISTYDPAIHPNRAKTRYYKCDDGEFRDKDGNVFPALKDSPIHLKEYIDV